MRRTRKRGGLTYAKESEGLARLTAVCILCVHVGILSGAESPSPQMEQNARRLEAFRQAIISGDLKSTQQALSDKVSANAELSNADDEEPALVLAARLGRKAIVSLLLEKGADPNRVEKPRKCALFEVARIEDKEIGKLLIKNGAKWKWEKKLGKLSPEFYLIRKFLLSNPSVTPQEISQSGFSVDDVHVELNEQLAELCAREDIDLEKLENLLSLGADPNAIFQDNLTALHLASAARSPKALQILLSAGADPNPVGKQYFIGTPLTIASRSGCTDAVKVLLDSKAHPNTLDCESTPLHFAANGKIAETLIKHGANVNALDKNGKTPFDVAKDEFVIDALRSAGGVSSSQLGRMVGNKLVEEVKTVPPEATPDAPTKDRDEKDQEKPQPPQSPQPPPAPK